MSNLKERIEALQKQQFVAINELHTNRTANMLLELTKKYGDEVLEIARDVKIDYIGLMAWHLKRTVDLMNGLKERFGDEAYEVLLEKERQDRVLNGSESAQECGSNTIQDILPYFGGKDNVVGEYENEYLIRTKSCGLAEAAKAAGISEFIYQLHCCNDPCFVEGFNPLLGCEVQKSFNIFYFRERLRKLF